MSFMKLSRVAIAALAVAVLLAVSTLAAYTFTIENTLVGLDKGVTYTAAKYDFANNTYGEFTKVTEETVFTAGIWGIKADDAEPEVVFVQTATESGKFNLWDLENETIMTSAFKAATLTNTFVPGYWSANKDGAFVYTTYYDDYPSICLHLSKEKFLVKAEVDGNKVWPGATAIIGDDNRLEESEYFYGFTNEQVIPVSAFESFKTARIALKTGAVTYKEGYTVADIMPKVVFYTKSIGSDVVGEYVGVSTYDGTTEILSATLPENIPTDAYIVAVGFRPYDEAPDDLFVNNGDNNEAKGYYHHMFAKGVNGIDVKPLVFDAPTGLTGGLLTVEGLDIDKYYQWAPVLLNATGDGFTYGEWNELTDETDVSGLVVVRYTNAAGSLYSEPSEIIYVNGRAVDRQLLGNFKDNGYVECLSKSTDWVVGYFAGSSAGQVGEGGSYKNYASLDQSVSTPADCQTLWLYDHTEESAKAKVEAHKNNTYPTYTGGSKPETLNAIIGSFYASKKDLSADEYTAERLAQAQKIANDMISRNTRYTFESEEIIPVDEINGFSFFTDKRQGCLVFSGRSAVVFKVMDLEGNVTDYKWVAETRSYANGGSGLKTYNVDVASLFEGVEGYLVGFAIYPYAEVDVDTIKIADASYLAAANISGRFIQNQAHTGWVADAYSIETPEYAKLEGLKGGYGRIAGLEEDGEYRYAYLLLNAAGNGLDIGEWFNYTESTQISGLVTVREITRDGGFTDPSDPVYVYGAKDVRLDLGTRTSAGHYNVKSLDDTAVVPQFNVGKWTGRQADVNTSAFGGLNGIGSYGSGWINANFSVDVKKAEAELAAAVTDEEKDAAQAKIDAARQKVVARATNNYFTYTYTSDEIVPINEVTQFGFTTTKRMGSATYTTTFFSTVDAYVVLPGGAISVHRFTTPLAANGAKRLVDFTDINAWTPALPTDGWLVALSVDQWAGMTDPNKFTFDNNGWNTMPNFVIDPKDYSVTDAKLVLNPCDADMSGLYIDGDVVKGFDKNIRYGVCKVTANGVSEEVTLLDKGVKSYTLDAGLWAFRVIGNGITESNSLPSKVFYKAGESRGNILHTTPYTCTGTANNGKVVDLLDQENAGKWADLELRYNPVFVEAKWVGLNISHGVYTTHNQGGPLNLGGTSCTVPSAPIKNAELALTEAQESGDLAAIEKAQNALDTVIADTIEQTESVWFTYQYTADEIIPMEEFVSHTFRAWARQVGFKVSEGGFQTAYTLRVITEDGELVDRTVYKDVELGYDKGSIHTVELSDFDETDGYIVGILIHPYGRAKEGTSLAYDKSWNQLVADLCVMQYTDGYKAKAPANAPEVEIVAANGGVDVVIKNAIAGASYAWSLDNKNWTSVSAGVTALTVPGAKSGDTIYVRMNAFEHYYDSYVTVATAPAFKDVPALTLGEGNVLFDETGAYEIAKYAFNTTLTYETLTEKTLTTGVWAVRTKGDDTTGASAPQVFYIAGENAGTINYVGGKADAGYEEGTWLSAYYNTMYANNSNYATAGSVEMHFNGTPTSFDKRRAFNIRYLFADDEIVPANQLINLNISTVSAFYHGYVKDGYTKEDGNGSRATATYGQTLARVWVVGTSVPYYDIYTDVQYTKGYSYNIGDFLADKDGYVVAIELYPLWSVYGADNKTDLGDNIVITAWNHSSNTGYYADYTLKMKFPNQFIENELPEGESLPKTNAWTTRYADGTNRFAIKLEKVLAPAPTLSISLQNVIKITNYNSAMTYVYSADDGKTWTELTTNSFTATKANTEYLVKVVTNSTYLESETTVITSHPLVVLGTSLVLDGQIGTKIYFDIDTDVVNVDKITLYNTKINDDYESASGSDNGYREYGTDITTTKSAKWSTKLVYEEGLGLYSITIFVPAKDADNISVQTELHYYLKATEEGAEDTQVKYGSVGSSFNVTDYIANAKALIEAGDEAFVAAADLIYATEKYVAYADAYLNNKTIDAYTSTNAITAEPATRTNIALDGIEFYGTSLILEDNVTIRHYFNVTDIDAFIAAGYTCDIEYGTKGDYIYFDITDIPAQKLGDRYDLKIKASTGSVIYTVSYSATNYMAEMAKDGNANLVSLVNAMYDYYVAAEDYAK